MGDRAEHTAGPWGMETVRTSCGVCHKIGPWPHKWLAGKTMSACIYDDYPSTPEGTDVMLANARLIAAAPDLLAALATCQKALAMMIEPKSISATSPQCAWTAAVAAETKARAAISRATGAS